MQINEEQSIVTFDRLIRADRSLGSAEAITIKSAEVAVAPNAKGVFAARTIMEINKSAKDTAAKLRKVLTA
jgi:hypothetical protein